MNITLSDELEEKVRYAAFSARGVKIEKEAPDLWSEIDAFSRECRARFDGLAPGEISSVKPARELFRSVGIDPTRRRPASEALLRRVLKGKPLYRINNAVDCCNFCSLRFLLPIGMYDASTLEGDKVTVRLGREGEAYKGLGKDSVTLHGQILLEDGAGPFGHPSGDSYRTRVRDRTSELLWVFFAPFTYDPAKLRSHLDFSMEWLTRAAGGETQALEA